MNVFTNAVPLWVSVLFLLTVPIPVVMIASLFRKGAIAARFSDAESRKVYLSVLAFFGVYFIYTSLLSFTGMFMVNTLPPKVFVYTAIPFLLIAVMIITNVKLVSESLRHVPLEALVGVHLFRLIGVFFFITEAYGALPTRFAYIGGIGDVATAVLSIFVVKAIKDNRSYARPMTIAWNLFGLADIVSVLVTAVVTTQQSIATGAQPITAIGAFPFSFIPAFAPATIIILHGVVFARIWSEMKATRQSIA